MSNLNGQQFGKHAAKTTKPAAYDSVRGHQYGAVGVASERTQGNVKVGYVGKHRKPSQKFRSDTEPDQGYSKSQIKEIHG